MSLAAKVLLRGLPAGAVEAIFIASLLAQMTEVAVSWRIQMNTFLITNPSMLHGHNIGHGFGHSRSIVSAIRVHTVIIAGGLWLAGACIARQHLP